MGRTSLSRFLESTSNVMGKIMSITARTKSLFALYSTA